MQSTIANFPHGKFRHYQYNGRRPLLAGSCRWWRSARIPDYHLRQMLMLRLGMKILASELTGVSCLAPLPIPLVCKLAGIVCLSHSRSGKRRRDPHNKHHLGLHIADHQVLRTWHRPDPRTVVRLVLRSRHHPERLDRNQLLGL